MVLSTSFEQLNACIIDLGVLRQLCGVFHGVPAHFRVEDGLTNELRLQSRFDTVSSHLTIRNHCVLCEQSVDPPVAHSPPRTSRLVPVNIPCSNARLSSASRHPVGAGFPSRREQGWTDVAGKHQAWHRDQWARGPQRSASGYRAGLSADGAPGKYMSRWGHFHFSLARAADVGLPP